MSQRVLVAGALVASLLAASGLPALAAPSDAAYTAIDEYVRGQMDANHLPGVAVAVVEDGVIAHARGFGRDAQGQPVTERTPFMIGSNSKSFTALAVMQLVETGQVNLDAPVQRYLPDFTLADSKAASQITVRQLLNHTSGLPAGAAGQELTAFEPVPLSGGLGLLRDVHLNAASGSRYEYSNAGYMVLGLLVEAVSHQPYAEYVQHSIFEPLEMHDTRLESGQTAGYRFWFGVPVADPMPYTAEAASVPVGGVVSTAEDMSHYLAMYQGQGQYQGRRVLSPAGIAEMQRGTVRVSFAEGDRVVTLDYGLGWAAGDIAGVPAVYHTGGSPQFSSWMVLIPSEQRAYITLSNSASYIPGPGMDSTETIPKGVMTLLHGATPRPGTSLTAMYLVLDSVTAMVVLLQGWSLVRVLRSTSPAREKVAGWWRRMGRMVRMGGPLVWEVGLSLLLVLGFPYLFEIHRWAHVMTYVPDLGSLVLVVSGLWLATALVRVVNVLRAAWAQPASGAIPARPSAADPPLRRAA